MDIMMSSKSKATDKLDGEFHVPLSYGGGSNKSVWLCCTKCHHPVSVGVNTQGFVCSDCDSYIGNRKDAEVLFEKLFEEGKLFTESNGAHIQTEGAKAMMAVRDTMQVKADIYAKGITRKSVGGVKYRQILNKTLKEYNVKPTKLKF